MDSYTTTTMEWLNRRYRDTSPGGIYFAHQPIYGIYDSHSEPNALERYLRTSYILRALSRLQGRSLLDVGASEGCQASLARNLLGLATTCCDLSEEACQRAREIYGLDAHQADARTLQFKDNQFDLVTCSETLEHIKDYELAVNEILLVARTAVVITVPHESYECVAENKATGELHAHINAFDLNSFDYLRSQGLTILVTKYQSRYWFRPSQWVERLRLSASAARFLVKPLSLLLINSDALIARTQRVDYYGILFILLKDKSAYAQHQQKAIQVSDILNYKVPYHYLGTPQVGL
jgi:ubiquinone/menaquinone biosynthesis C-methylase UbiE